MTDYTPQEVAAKWWSDILRNGETPSRDYNQPSAELDPMAQALVILSAKPLSLPDYQVDAFESTLRFIIGSVLRERNTVIVNTEYGAGHLLLEAQKLTPQMPDISGALPWLTVMWVQRDSVKVRSGRGGEVVSLWTKAASND